MALNLNDLSKIREEKKCTVYGYVREQYEQDVPNGIILICILFYGSVWDEWDKDTISKYIKLDEETRIITQTGNSNTCSTFLKEVVDSGIHKWKFKIIKCGNHAWATMDIGIWNIENNDGNPPINGIFFEMCGKDHCSGYAFSTSNARKKADNSQYRDYGEKCKDGVIVDMTVDFDALSLSFMVNDKEYGKAFDIEPGKYRAACYLYFTDDSFQFIEKY